MTDVSITGAGAASAVNATDHIPATQSGVAKYITPAQIKTYLNIAAVGYSGSASDLNTGTLPDARLSAVPQSLAGLTIAKGTIPIGSGSASFAALAAGTDGWVLTLDSTQTTGVKWAAASGGISTLTVNTTPTSGASAGQILVSDGSKLQAAAGFLAPTSGVNIQFGGATASYPALKRSTTNLQVRLADDSGYAGSVAANYTAAGVTFANLPGSPATGTIATCTDSPVTTGTVTAGGGSNSVLVCYLGSAWVVIGALTTASVLLDSIAGSFNGVTTTFNLTSSSAAVTPVNAQSLLVVLGGVVQQPTSAYTVSSSTITFTTAPASGDTCFIVMPNSAASVPVYGPLATISITDLLATGYFNGFYQFGRI